jgi:hypothetical protein
MEILEIIEHNNGSVTFNMSLTNEEVKLLLSSALFQAIKASVDDEINRIDSI